MQESSRQKLLNWLTSMVLVLAFTASSIALSWFVAAPSGMYGFRPVDIYGAAISLHASFLIYPFLFLPVAIWHLADGLQYSSPEAPSVSRLSGYPIFAIALSAAGVFAATMFSGVTMREVCLPPPADPNRFMFDGCALRPSLWIEYPAGALFFILIAICVVKTVVSLKTRFMSAP